MPPCLSPPCLGPPYLVQNQVVLPVTQRGAVRPHQLHEGHGENPLAFVLGWERQTRAEVKPTLEEPGDPRRGQGTGSTGRGSRPPASPSGGCWGHHVSFPGAVPPCCETPVVLGRCGCYSGLGTAGSGSSEESMCGRRSCRPAGAALRASRGAPVGSGQAGFGASGVRLAPHQTRSPLWPRGRSPQPQDIP